MADRTLHAEQEAVWGRVPLPLAELGHRLNRSEATYFDKMLETIEVALRVGAAMGLARCAQLRLLASADQAGTFDFTAPAGTNEPAFSSGGLDFDGSDDALQSGETVVDAGAWTMAVDFKLDALPGSGASVTVLSFVQTDSPRTMAMFKLQNAAYQGYVFGGGIGTTSAQIDRFAESIDTNRHQIVISSDGSTYTARLDGSDKTALTDGPWTGVGYNYANTLGAEGSTSSRSNFMNGKIYEVIVFDHQLDSTERATLNAWITDHDPGDSPTTIDDGPLLWLRPGYGQDGVTRLTTADTARVQTVELDRGTYRLSWYARAVTGIASEAVIAPEDAVEVAANVADEVVELSTPSAVQDAGGALGSWERHYVLFDVSEPGSVDIKVPIGQVVFSQIDLAGLMLEDVSTLVPAAWASSPEDYPPREFAETSDTLTRDMAVCEDTDGTRFRTENWHRGCLRLCDEGYARECSISGPAEGSTIPLGELQCFWETSFAITQQDIDRGNLFRAGGFAYGNYNYRFDSLALNFVGTGAHSCEDSRLPGSCYSAAWIPFSINHDGDFMVRNHNGEDYRAPLFPGRIEHGRGLAAERKLTNPISGTDRALLEDYMHREFRGRPLAGRYTLRVWDAPGVDFDSIEDVEILLNYRYWTRFE